MRLSLIGTITIEQAKINL